jgi:acetyl-CoA carboxylase alpha subunit
MASAYTLDFEKPLLELERQIDDLKRIGTERQIDIDGELEGLQNKLVSLRGDIYRNSPILSSSMAIGCIWTIPQSSGDGPGWPAHRSW